MPKPIGANFLIDRRLSPWALRGCRRSAPVAELQTSVSRGDLQPTVGPPCIRPAFGASQVQVRRRQDAQQPSNSDDG